LKKVGAVSRFIKKFEGFPMIFSFFEISQNYFCIGKVMNRLYGSRDHDWLSVHGGLPTMGWCGHSIAREVVVIVWKEIEGEEVVRVLTIGITWRRSYEDNHMTVLNRGGQWCSNGEIVPGASRRDWSRGGCGG
jgi:hypothetical protein